MKSIEFKEWEAHSDFSYCYGKLHLIVDGKEWVSEGLGCLKHSFGCWIDDKGEEHFKSGQCPSSLTVNSSLSERTKP